MVEKGGRPMSASIVLFVLALATQLPPAPPPVRDAAARDPSAAAAGTATIRGRVTDAESGRPLGRVMVMLVSSTFASFPDDVGSTKNARMSEPRTTLTGVDGRFEYKEVAAGAYYVAFEPSELRGSHLSQNFGETGPANPFRTGKRPTLVVKDGEVRDDVNVALVRSLAVEGRVVDEQGEPMSNVQVSAHLWDGPAQAFMGRPRSTDDRGAFRLFGLKPGQYRICAKPEVHFGPSEEIRDRLMSTCYPAAIGDANAEPVRVDSTDVVGIDIRVQRGRAYKISGVALDSSGAPIERPQVSLVTMGKMGWSSNGITSLPGGQFRAQAVTPGEYAILVEIGSRYNPEDKRERELGYLPISVDSADVEGVVVTTSKLAKVAGRIVFEEGLPETMSEKIKVTTGMTRTTPHGMMTGPPASAEVRDDSTFELTGLFGPQIVAVTGQPRGWVVKSVKYRGEDVTDLPVEFKTSTDPRALEVVLTRRVALVSGRALDDEGKPIEEGFVVLLPADAARRKAGRHLLKFATLKSDGAYSLGPVRAGEYIIAALGGTQILMLSLSFDDGSTEKVERIAAQGERILLVENDQRTMELRVLRGQ
jgi:hypothetical protein